MLLLVKLFRNAFMYLLYVTLVLYIFLVHTLDLRTVKFLAQGLAPARKKILILVHIPSLVICTRIKEQQNDRQDKIEKTVRWS